MIGDHSLILRGAIGVAMSTGAVISWKLVPRLRISDAGFIRAFMAAYAASRLGIYALAMLVLHLRPQGDVLMYMEEAGPALAGKLIYRDFITPHAPLSPYFLASMLRLHHSPLTLILFATLFDILTVCVWLKAGAFFLDAIPLRRAAALILFSPTSLLTEAIDGQMNALIALCLALAVYALMRRRNLLSGALAAVPVCAVKFITLMFAPGFLFASRRKAIAAAGFALVILATYLPFALAGADLTTPLRAEGAHLTPSNVIFLVELVTGWSLGLRLPDAMLGLAWLLAVGVTFLAMRRVSASTPPDRRRIFHLLTLSMIAELLCIIVFSKNTWDRYLVMAMFPLCVLVAEMNFVEVVGYAIFAVVAAWEPTYYALVMGFTPATELHHQLMAGDHRTILMLGSELIEVGGSVYLWVACLRRMWNMPALAESHEESAKNALTVVTPGRRILATRRCFMRLPAFPRFQSLYCCTTRSSGVRVVLSAVFCAGVVWCVSAPVAAQDQTTRTPESMERLRLHATEQWRQIEEHLPNPATATPVELEQQADILRARRFPEDAVDYYKYALARGGDPVSLLNKLGLTQLEMRNVELARACFKQTVKLGPKSAQAWNNLGAVEYLDRGTGAAISDYKHAIKLDKRQSVFHANLATAYFETKDYGGARKEMTTALKLEPGIFDRDSSSGGVQAHVLTSNDRARFSFEMARLYAQDGEVERMLHSLGMASEAGMDIQREMSRDSVLVKFENDPRVVVLVHNAQMLKRGGAPISVSSAGAEAPLAAPKEM